MFPEDFLWGVSLSGFQFEMGDLNGRWIDHNTDWFAWVHDKENIRKGIVSGDFPENGVNYWELYKVDHKIAKELGLNAFRIGIEWSRIFPMSTSSVEVDIIKSSDGFISRINVDDNALEQLDRLADKQALEHYRQVILDLRENNFKVFVCLNHFTLPIWLHDPITVRNTNLRKGPRGWIDEESIVEFVKYSAYIAWKLGDVVDYWATFNEPVIVAEVGYTNPEAGFPPCINNFKAFKKTAVNLAIAHARAYDVIKKMDNIKADSDSDSSAEIGVIHNIIPANPLDPNKDSDIKGAEFFNHMHNLFFIEAATTGWLDININGIKERGEVKNYMGNRLDWLGINYYTRMVFRGKFSILAKLFAGMPTIPSIVKGYGFACDPNSVSLDNRSTSDFGWEIYPEGLMEALEIAERYGRPLYVTENGIADANDKLRPKYIIEHLKILDEAISKKIDVRGYFHWALTDNYEWAHGFRMKFGLYAVDLSTKKRIPRKSSQIIKEIIKNKKVFM